MSRRNLTLTRGDTFPFTTVVYNGSSTIDVTGYQFRMTAKYDIQDADSSAVFSITSPGQISLTDPTNGKVLITILPTNTSGLQRGLTYRLIYDIQMYNDPATIYTVSSGILTVLPDVSTTTP